AERNRINQANNTYYNTSGNSNGNSTYVNGVEGGNQWNPATGRFDLPPAWTGSVYDPTFTGAKPQSTPGFGTALDGKPVAPGASIPNSAIPSTQGPRPFTPPSGPNVNPI